MDITGIVKSIGLKQQVSDKFAKRDLILFDNSNPNYPNTLLFQFTQKNCELLDKVAEGEEVKVFFNLKGKEYTNKQGVTTVFNSLEGWKLESINNPSKRSNEYPKEATPLNKENEPSDLPF